MPIAEMLAKRPKGIIFSGGPASVHVDGAPSIDPAIYEAGVPILGICYGAQLVALQLGGDVRRTGGGEYGRTPMTRCPGPSVLLPAGRRAGQVWMSHGDAITCAARGFVVTGLDRVRPSPRSRTATARSTACSSTPRSCTPSGARTCCARSCSTCAGAARPGRTRTSSRRPSPRSVRRSATSASSAALRWGRLGRRGRTRPPRDR